MAPYIPWKDRKAAERARMRPSKTWCDRYQETRRAKIEDQAFDSGIEKLIEFADAWDWLESIPHYLWFTRNSSVECLPEFQAQGRRYDA